MRIDNWSRFLEKVIQAAEKKEFSYGTHDCCLFTADCVDAIMGTSIAQMHRGQYDADTQEAYFNNVGGVEGLIAAQGFEEIPITMARRGDVILTSLPGNPLGVIDNSGQRIAVAAPKKIAFISLDNAIRAWRVE